MNLKTVCFVLLAPGCEAPLRRQILDTYLEIASIERGYYPEYVDPFRKQRRSLGQWATTLSAELPAETRRLIVSYPFDDRAEQLLDRNPQPEFFLLSVYTSSRDVCIACLAELRRRFPKARLVVGGAHATFAPEDCATFDCDLVWQGEADGHVRDILSTAARAGPARPPSLAAGTQPERLTRPDWELYFEYSDYVDRHMPRAMLSRDCVHRCAFCTPRGSNRIHKSRRADLDEFEQEIAIMMRSVDGNGLHLRFTDPDFLMDAGRLDDTLRLLERSPLTWDCQTRIPLHLDRFERLTQRMRAAGCRSVFFGIESRDPFVLQRIRKRFPAEHVDAAVDACVSADLMVLCNLIAGLPDQTEGSIHDDIEWARDGLLSGRVGCVDVQVLQLLPGTPIATAPEAFGVMPVDDFTWSRVEGTVQHSTTCMTDTQIRAACDQAVDTLNETYRQLYGPVNA